MKKFLNKYRIPSARLQNYDYGSNGAYFVTICTANRECYFGEISDGQMILSAIGDIAFKYWIDIPNHFPFVVLDAFVIMPNHVHGIIVIDKHESVEGTVPVETQNFASLPVSDNNVPPVSDNNAPKNKFGRQSQNLASIIRGYKSGVKKYATINQIHFAWQPRYHDHIIRNNDEHRQIADYIRDNPSKWSDDSMNT